MAWIESDDVMRPAICGRISEAQESIARQRLGALMLQHFLRIKRYFQEHLEVISWANRPFLVNAQSNQFTKIYARYV